MIGRGAIIGLWGSGAVTVLGRLGVFSDQVSQRFPPSQAVLPDFLDVTVEKRQDYCPSPEQKVGKILTPF